MSYNGSGTFNINSAGQPVVSGTVISSTAFNALTSDLATGLTTALTKDGQTTPTANISLGSYKITNLAAGTAATDAVRFDQLTSAGVPLITVAGTANAITGTVTPSLTVYATGDLFSFVVGSNNTGAVTLNIDGVGVKSVTRTGSVALVANDMVAGQVVLVEYDGTRFQLLNGNSFTNLNLVTPLLGTPTSGVATNLTGLPLTTGVTGTLPVANGGTGAATLTSNNVLLGNGTSALQAVAPSTSGNVLTSNGTTWQSTAPAGGLVNGTAVTPGAVTTVDFTGFPAGLKRIVINYDGLSLNSADNILVQMMVSATAVTSGYTSAVSQQQNAGTNYLVSSTAGFIVTAFAEARATVCGSMMLSLIDTNQWVEMNAGWDSSAAVSTLNGGGAKTLAGAVTGIRITSVGGTATFDAGKVNIQYE